MDGSGKISEDVPMRKSNINKSPELQWVRGRRVFVLEEDGKVSRSELAG